MFYVELPERVIARMRAAMAAGGLGFAIDREAAAQGGIALLGTIGAVYVLRVDGTVWVGDEDSARPYTRADPREALAALVYGVERFEWLAELLPDRPPAAPDCHGCGGRRVLRAHGATGGVNCPDCGGLGWTVEEGGDARPCGHEAPGSHRGDPSELSAGRSQDARAMPVEEASAPPASPRKLIAASALTT